jgi:hypothetical protein
MEVEAGDSAEHTNRMRGWQISVEETSALAEMALMKLNIVLIREIQVRKYQNKLITYSMRKSVFPKSLLDS